jgi:hypothetical protein
MSETDQKAAMKKFDASNNKMASAVDGLSRKLNSNLEDVAKGTMSNINTIGKAWASKNAEILIKYGCDKQCINSCARRWMSMDSCISGRRNVCDCPSVIDIEAYAPADSSIGITPRGITFDN